MDLKKCSLIVHSRRYHTVDVPPTNVTQYTVKGLMLGTEYEFLVMAKNRLGDGQYIKDGVRSSTSSEFLILIWFCQTKKFKCFKFLYCALVLLSLLLYFLIRAF